MDVKTIIAIGLCLFIIAGVVFLVIKRKKK
jgi:LPXTG-motif cell wall-anchored protein